MAEKRNTHQKRMILDTLCEMKNHPTANMVYERLQEMGSHISKSTVYRNLSEAAEDGIILKLTVMCVTMEIRSRIIISGAASAMGCMTARFPIRIISMSFPERKMVRQSAVT